MTTLLQQIEEMRVHVKDLASYEQRLVKALGDELNRADEELLHSIRNVAVEHDVRRSSILTELQLLAANVGLLPSSSKLWAAGEIASRDSSKFAVRHDELPTMRQDWQHAAASFEERLHSHLNGRTHEASIVPPAWT